MTANLMTNPMTITKLLKLFWQSSNRFYAYSLLIIIVSITIIMVGLDVIFSFWQNEFYDALQAYDKKSIVDLFYMFLFLAGLIMVIAVFRYYLSQTFGLRWRKWLTQQIVNRWLKNHSYYLLENFETHTDNPDQRIQEDIGALVNYSISLSIGLIAACTTFFAFIYVLWRLSGNLIIPLGSFGKLAIPGYLVWVGILYAVIGTFLTVKIGKPLVGLNFEQQRREATFRYAAVDLRSHAEHVALYHGETHQKKVLNRLFQRVLDNAYLIIIRQKKLLWFTAGYNQTAVILPLLVALPNYFDKVFMLGGLIQSMRAFGAVQDSLSFIVNAYTQLAEWKAVALRLTTFMNHMNTFEESAAAQNDLILTKHPSNRIILKKLYLKTPQDKPLLSNINQTFIHGQHYLIKGASGVGKSTLIRTIAGIWPFAAGEIMLPQQKKMMYLPQKSYMPLGSLSEALLFPNGHDAKSLARLEYILSICQLGQYVNRLQEVATWSQELSPGEQQRVAFARILFHQPDWVFLDESTSMLDLDNEKQLYTILKSELPACSIVSVGHRASLDPYHDHIITLNT